MSSEYDTTSVTYSESGPGLSRFLLALDTNLCERLWTGLTDGFCLAHQSDQFAQKVWEMVGLVARKAVGRSPSIVGVDGLIFIPLNTAKIIKCSWSFILRTPLSNGSFFLSKEN